MLSDYNHITRSFVRVFLVFPEMFDKFLHIVRICQKILRNFLKTNLFQNRYQYIIQFCTFGETNASGNCCPSNSLNKEKTSVLEISEKKSYRPVIQFHLFVKKYKNMTFFALFSILPDFCQIKFSMAFKFGL